MNNEPVEETRTVKLEKLKFVVLQKISPKLIDAKIDINEHASFLADEILMRVRGFVWGESVGAQTISYPRDWWQAFKARWFPAWALRRWPVRYEEVMIDIKVLYPNFRPSLPGEAHSVVYQQHKKTDVT